MASVKVAVRVRPLNQREQDMESKFIISMEGKRTSIINMKVPENSTGDYARERVKDFTFDYSYWSVSKKSPQFAPQSQVFHDLGLDVVKSAYEGYNTCVLAYGQTGSGKTYTMMGNPGDEGLIPRICEAMFAKMKDDSMTYRTEVSYLEIYNEKVRDLLKNNSNQKQTHSLRIREHPKDGPYVQDLSKHLVMNYEDIKELMDKGNDNRTTACTLMNDVSSRSHAIFTMVFTQAKFSKDVPLETQSKIHLVDLAGSERADATGATGQRLKEGGSINKSLVTLGNVISALADLSEKGMSKKNTVFIPYRDSVLTWLLKDSLGGNAKTMMIAAISPADCNYGETMSTLRYANRAKNIINKPRVNEDPNVKLIRDLRSEILQLRLMLGDSVGKITSPEVQEQLDENEARVKLLTDEWAGKWSDINRILEEKTLALRKEGHGVVLDSDVPHLIGIDDDILSTGIRLYDLREGETTIGTDEADPAPDICLQGIDLMPHHCVIENHESTVTIIPKCNSLCTVNGNNITEPTTLTQGAVVVLGKTNMFRFNHPDQVAKLKKEFKGSNLNLSRMSLLSQSMTDLCRSSEALNSAGLLADDELRLNNQKEQLEQLQMEAQNVKDQAHKAQKKAEREVAKYKRRSMDVERQLQDFMEQQLMCDLPGGRGTSGGDPRAAHRHRGERILSELETEIGRKKERLEQERDEELKLLEFEREQLLMIDKDPRQFSVLEAEMDESLTAALREDNTALVERQAALAQREQAVYAEYKEEEQAITDAKNLRLRELDDERWKLQADKIYVRELETNLEQMAAEASSEAELEELERERTALNEEKDRMNRQENDIEKAQLSIQRDTETKRDALLVKRSAQVEELNKVREDCRLMEKSWHTRLGHELQNKVRTIEEVGMRVQDGEEEVEALEARYRILSGQVRGREARVEERRRAAEIMQDVGKEATEGKQPDQGAKTEARNAKDVCNESEAKRSKMDLLDTNISAIANVTSSCEASNASGLELTLNDGDTSENASNNSLKPGRSHDVATSPLAEVLPEIAPLDPQYSDLTEAERKALVAKMKEICLIEEQIRNNVTPGSGNAQQMEASGLDPAAELALEDLEDAGRLTLLVEQEVRQRLLEERIEHERKWSARHREERAQRDQEIAKIRKSHQRELQRLQKKDSMGRENEPTRANPYASFTSGDVTPSLSRTNSKKGKAVLERAASIGSIHSTISSISPITGNPFRVTIPTYLHRGSGLDVYYEYEIKLSVIDEKWTVFRRYRRFLELHNELKLSYPEVAGIVFPPRRFFGSRSEKTVAERQQQLECYLQHVLEILWRKPESPIHPSRVKLYCKNILCDFNSFFKKGMFETGKYSTG